VVWGYSSQSDWQPGYAPWIGALGEYARAVPIGRLKEELGSGAAAIDRLVPAVHSLLPDLPAPSPPGLDQDRIRLHDAVVQFLLMAAKKKPLVLVFDDLHWVDGESLTLLRHMSHFLAGSGLLIVCAYREGEPGVTEPSALTEAMSAIRRDHGYVRIDVQSLSRDEVRELLAVAAGQAVPEAIVQAIHEATDGNPFYVKEVIQHLLEEQKLLLREGRWSTDSSIRSLGISRGIRELLEARRPRLSADGRLVLGTAPGFSDDFELRVRRRLTSLPEERLLAALDELLKSGFIAVADNSIPSYRFTHAIIRQALYEETSPDRCVRLHRSIARALEDVYARRRFQRAGEIASQYHLSRGLGDSDKGIRYALTAAAQARSAYSPQQAVVFLKMALALAEDKNASVRAEILAKLAIAQAESLMLQEAKDTAEEARRVMAQPEWTPKSRERFWKRSHQY